MPPVVRAATVTYVYDELGRLVGVVDPAGESVVFSYDIVGNLLLISRHASSVVSIIDFTPHSGPVGATVTVSGTGFSTTPIQNSVAFNGAAATASSSTATQIVTAVPDGTTTGPISVTTPGGSASSSTSFTVTSGGSPTITGFTPTVGTAGVTIATITGTNFAPAPLNNKVQFNIFLAPVTSAAPTTVGASAPAGGTSGRITVVTPAGKAVSAGDFFIPPAPYTAADVEVSGRMAIGESRAVTVTTPGKIALLVLDGTAGQRVSLGMSAVTIAATDVTMFKPDGSSLATLTGLGTAGGVIDAPPLPVTGTYTVLVDPQATNTGSLTVTVSQQLSGTIVVDGAPVTLALDKPGQSARLTFTGTAGQKLGLGTTAVTIAQTDISILSPDGSTLFGPTLVDTQGNGFDLPVLPASGTYTIFVNPRSINTGSITLTLSQEITGALTVNGSALAITLRAGQHARLTFSGSTGQDVGLGFTSVTTPGSDVSVLNPDGTTLVAPYFIGTNGDTITPPALPVTGTYTVFIDPRRNNSGSMTVTLSQDQSGTITIGGPAVTVTITRPGQNARLTFSGTAGQQVSVQMATGAVGSDVSILKPDGTTLAGRTFAGASGGFLDQATLPVPGTYTILVDPRALNTGSMTLTLFDATDITGTITIGGPAVTVTTARPGQNARLTFSGTAGQQATVRLAGNTIGTTTVTLLNPDGTTLTSATSNLDTFTLTTQTLPATGTYTVSIDPGGTRTGNLSVTVTSP